MRLQLRVRIVDNFTIILEVAVERAPSKVDTLGQSANHEIEDWLHAGVPKVNLIKLFSDHVKSEEVVLELFVPSNDSVSLFSLQRGNQGQSGCLVNSS